MRRWLTRFRSLPLEEVAAALCLELVQQSWRHERHQIRINGTQFYDWHESQLCGGGGAIDLVMHVNQSDFKSAVAWLADRFGEIAVQIAIREYAQAVAESAQKQCFVAPVASAPQWPIVRADLVSRQLPGKLLDQLDDQGLLYADPDGAMIFIQRDLQTREMTGAYRLSRTGFSGTMLGSDRAKGRFYWLRGGQADDAVQRVVVGQTPIYVLAIGLMQPEPPVRTLYLSADGALPIAYLQGFGAKQVVVMVNRDAGGDRLREQAQRALPEVRCDQAAHRDCVSVL